MFNGYGLFKWSCILLGVGLGVVILIYFQALYIVLRRVSEVELFCIYVTQRNTYIPRPRIIKVKVEERDEGIGARTP